MESRKRLPKDRGEGDCSIAACPLDYDCDALQVLEATKNVRVKLSTRFERFLLSKLVFQETASISEEL